MKTGNKDLGVYRLLTLLMVIFIVAAVGGLGLVWLRQEITHRAEGIRTREGAVVDLKRRLRSLDAKVAIAQQPEFLKLSVAARELPLKAPAADRVVYLEAGKAGSPDAVDRPSGPITISYDLALIDRPEGDVRQ